VRIESDDTRVREEEKSYLYVVQKYYIEHTSERAKRDAIQERMELASGHFLMVFA